MLKIIPGALRILFLQLTVDDGNYVMKAQRAGAATDALSAKMRAQSAVTRQYNRDLALTAGVGALALGLLVRSYARVEEVAARTVFATNDLTKIQNNFHGEVTKSVAVSANLAAQMRTTVLRAQQLSLAIEEAGLESKTSHAAFARASIMLERMTGRVVTADTSFTTLYRTLKLTKGSAEEAGEAASYYASLVAIAGNESAAGIAANIQYLNTFKDISLAVPVSTEQLIALSAAMADVNENTREMVRTSFIRLFAKGTSVPAAEINAILARYGEVGSVEEAERFRTQDAPSYIFALARTAAKARQEDQTKLATMLGLTNVRDIVTLTQAAAAQDAYSRIIGRFNVEQQAFIRGGEKATLIYQAHSKWLTTLSGQGERAVSALTRMNTQLNTTLSFATALPVALGVGALEGLANAGALPGILAVGGAGIFGVNRLRGIRALRDARLAGLDSHAGGAFLQQQRKLDMRRVREVLGKDFRGPISAALYGDVLRQSLLDERKAFDADAQRTMMNELRGRITPATFLPGVAMGWPHSPNVRRQVQLTPELIAARQRAIPDFSTLPNLRNRPTQDRGFARNTLADLLFMGTMMSGGLGSLGTRIATSSMGRRLSERMLARRMMILETGMQAGGMSRFAQRGATTLARFGLGRFAQGAIARGATGLLTGVGVAGPIGLLVGALAALTPIARGLADALQPLIDRGGALSGVLRIVRLVFRTLELAGAGLSAMFAKLWDGFRFILKPFVDLPAWDQAGSALDTLDVKMAGLSERLRPGTATAVDTSTPASRAATIGGGNVYNTTIVANNVDSTRSALLDAKIIPTVS